MRKDAVLAGFLSFYVFDLLGSSIGECRGWIPLCSCSTSCALYNMEIL
ncbi:hypothetical protein LCGC14_2223680, partial [marine sediment metagenome]